MNESTYKRHEISCLQHESALVKMIPSKINKLKCKNWPARRFAPVVNYFDSVSILQPLTGCQIANQSTSVTEIQKASGFCFVGIEQGNPDPVSIQLEKSENCMEKFVETLQKIAREIHEKKQNNRYFCVSVPKRPQGTQLCWICEGQLRIDRDLEDDTVIDHCHHSRSFLGFAHPECNFKRKTVNFFPVMAHKISNYDLHHVCLIIHKFKPGCKIEVIPSTDEKNIPLTVGAPVRTYQVKNGKTKTSFEYLRFMASPLEKLTGFLKCQEKFKIMDRCYTEYSAEDLYRSLIHQKVYQSYSYFDNFDFSRRNYHHEINGRILCATGQSW